MIIIRELASVDVCVLDDVVTGRGTPFTSLRQPAIQLRLAIHKLFEDIFHKQLYGAVARYSKVLVISNTRFHGRSKNVAKTLHGNPGSAGCINYNDRLLLCVDLERCQTFVIGYIDRVQSPWKSKRLLVES